jgi:hypothetical protein
MESPEGNNQQCYATNLLTPINGISPTMRGKCVNEFAFYQKANSNLLKIDAEQAIGIDPRME